MKPWIKATDGGALYIDTTHPEWRKWFKDELTRMIPIAQRIMKKFSLLSESETIATDSTQKPMTTPETKNPALEGLEAEREKLNDEINELSAHVSITKDRISDRKSRLKKVEKAIKDLS